MSTTTNTTPKTTTKHVPFRVLQERGWTRDMLKTHNFRRASCGWSLAQAEIIESTPEWQQDSERVASGQLETFRRGDRFGRGWSKAMITEQLAEPDAVARLGCSGTRVQYLWRAARVATIEQTAAFRERAARAHRRSRIGVAAAERRRAEAEATPWWEDPANDYSDRITVDTVSEQDLAAAVTNADDCHRGDPAHRDRIMVNHIRHQLTNYDALLAADAQPACVKRDVLSAIARVYPQLSDECSRQDPVRQIEDWSGEIEYEAQVRRQRSPVGGCAN